jgi:kumamolisin
MATRHIQLPGSQRSLLPGSKVLATANPNQWVEVTLKLRRKAPLDLTGRPKARLSRKDLADRYGASAEDLAAVKSVLGKLGLEVLEENPAARSVEVGGPVSAMERAFQVKLFRCSHAAGDYRGRSGTIQIPAELAGIVVGVFGLDDRRVVRRARRPRPHAAAPSLVSARHRGFLPTDLAKLYDFPPGDGAGQTIGILEFGGGYLPDDLRLYCQTAGVDVPNVVPVSVDHTPTNVDDDAAVEVMLDIEVVAGFCPRATIAVYFGRFTERGWIRTLDAAVHDPQREVSVLSVSWGAPEGVGLWTPQALDVVHDTFADAAMMQISVCVASGDDGSDDQVGDGLAHVDFPASSPAVLAVGGTDLRVIDGQPTETAWKDGDGLRADGGGSSGGGVSAHFPRPQFQADVNVAPVNPGAQPGRVIPDVAAHAESDGQTTGYFMVIDGQAGPNGGTSAAAPLWAALLARINGALGDGKRAGYLTPLLYQAARGGGTVGSGACKDVTDGDNISAAGGGFRAGPGYDAVTGWGSPLGSKLLAALRQLV